jgi:hypothetical protein
VPSLKRLRPGGPDQVIDLTDASDTAARIDGGGDTEGPDGGPDAGAGDQGTAADDDVPTPEPGAQQQPQDAQADSGDAPATGASPGARWPRALGWLFLTRSTAGTLAPFVSIGVALVWLTGAVLLGSVLLTFAIGAISEQGLLYPPILVGIFRMAHGMPVHSADGAVSLVPMLPAIAVVALIARTGGWVWRALQPREPGLPNRGPTPTAGLGALAGGYLAVATLVATSPTTGAPAVPLLQGWGALLGVVVIGTGWAWAWHGVRSVRPRRWLLLRAAATVVAIVLGIAFALVLLRLLASWSQFQGISDALLASGAEPSTRFDAVALGALQLAYLPNVVVWTAAYLVGAGFAVGADTIVSPFSVTVGTVPELPLATLLPDSGLRWPWLPLLLVALASVLAGAGIRSAGLARRMRTRLVLGGLVAVGAALALGILAAASSGGLGEGRLAVMGPSPWLTLLWALFVIGIGQLAWALFPTVLADVGPLASNIAVRVRQWRLPRRRPGRAQVRRPQIRRRRRRTSRS